MSTPEDLSQSADKAAISLSLICAVHCLLLPVAVAVVPSAAMFGFDDTWFHRVLLLFVLPMSIFALLSGLRKHKNRTVLAIGITGLLTLIAAALIGHDTFGETGERLVTLVGSILVAVSHFRNFQLCQLRLPAQTTDQ